MPQKVIIDGDWGGDEMQLAAALLACPGAVTVVGATCVFGNTPHANVLANALSLLQLLNASHIPVHPGATHPTAGAMPEGDNAHGADGVGGIPLPRASTQAQTLPAVDFILDTLRREPAGSVVITATGPLTNIAQALAQDAATMRRVKSVNIMGGCTAALPAADMPTRNGNITPGAEFNFHMAPHDAAAVMTSGLPINLFPMECTQQLMFTPAREQMLRAALKDSPHADTVVNVIKAPAALDRAKFNADPFMHDVHTALHLLYPAQYAGRSGHISVDINGHSDFIAASGQNLYIMENVKDSEALFDCVLISLKACLLPHQH